MGRTAFQRTVSDRQKGIVLEKERFIKSVSEALGRPKVTPGPPYPLLQESLQQLEEKASAALESAEERRPQLVERLAQVSQDRGWKVYRASSPDQVQDYVRKLAQSQESTLVIRSDQQVFQVVPVDEILGKVGVQVIVASQAQGHSRGHLRENSATAGIGITGVDYAIAETGSVVLLPRAGLSRLVSLAPPVHVAIVRPEDIVDDLEDLFILRRLAYHRGEAGSAYMNFITGPSRTADIEQTLVIGVHGPLEVHMVIL